ncbi:hypothetical protein ACWGMK_13360 [Agrobacterium deltaense]
MASAILMAIVQLAVRKYLDSQPIFRLLGKPAGKHNDCILNKALRAWRMCKPQRFGVGGTGAKHEEPGDCGHGKAIGPSQNNVILQHFAVFVIVMTTSMCGLCSVFNQESESFDCEAFCLYIKTL